MVSGGVKFNCCEEKTGTSWFKGHAEEIKENN